MTADSYSPTKEQVKDVKMVNENKNVVIEVEERHFLFKCMKMQTLDKVSVFLAELIGTALLVFFGCMGCASSMGVPSTHLNICINFGLTVMFIVQIFGCVSGSHINPAVTAAAYIYNLVTLPMAAVYFVAQMIGGFVGFGLLKAVSPAEAFFPNNSTIGLCTTMPNPQISPFQGMLVELLITASLIWVVCGVWDPRNAKHHDSVPIKFGLTIASLALAAGPWTGASMNPARSFAPAIWNGNFQHHWVYWVGPMAGGILAALAYKTVFRREVPVEKELKAAEEFPLSRERNNA
ncbi:aquaporin AQPAn.G-like isoform X1 [Hermetia illucens]|uniref:aquaporin AQPAn.G-like isoform X1 n=1 Tax=Hermetia illucens TaxID=343691 RepID=UPI0018CBFEA5|nr:aquaporin AQPAn.G-like isoform X1 [Hermetia illucens]XP_037914413.1 aquaporin AQPAn.G-like isoform X1 [Hermetia illucens]XP_037914414.1 aquaporin AQPAn.G-like isoform X1 [Hermetia illucens]